ncbi:Uncharacterised protein [Raoultella terrigena]|uniref:Uncharacterized protein n=1 Tax=Raoultella terrigena TaxID=577 RepID=A0A3P8M1F8_RAOTE|nr:Uncharacterised protein [Raoultella terrigena]
MSFTGNNEDSVMQRIQAGDADLSLYLDVPPQAAVRQYLLKKEPVSARRQQRCGELHRH